MKNRMTLNVTHIKEREG